jgi:hypothetical protein
MRVLLIYNINDVEFQKTCTFGCHFTNLKTERDDGIWVTVQCVLHTL